MEKMDDKYYSTSDLGHAAAISLFFPIEKIDRTNPRRAVFVFKRTKDLEEIVEKYWRKELRVDPLEYFLVLRAIKSRLYEKDNI